MSCLYLVKKDPVVLKHVMHNFFYVVFKKFLFFYCEFKSVSVIKKFLPYLNSSFYLFFVKLILIENHKGVNN